MMPAAYMCLGCKFSWKGLAGPTECPMCGHIYIKWLNYGIGRKLKEW